MTFLVTGNHGTLLCDAVSGTILEYRLSPDAMPGYTEIIRFDVNEWQRTYPQESLDQRSIDILDLGYWTASGAYVSPDEDWRRAFRHLLQTGKLGRLL